MVTRIRGVLVSVGVFALGVGAAGAAYGDYADVPFLSSILANGLAELAQLEQSVVHLMAVYQESVKMVKYAENAKHAFQEVQSINSAFHKNNALGAFLKAYPVARSLGHQVQYGADWFGGQAGFAPPGFQNCLNALDAAASKNNDPTGACATWAATATGQLEKNLDVIFGVAPASKPHLGVARVVTQNNYREAEKQTQKQAVAEGTASRIRKQCVNATDPSVCAQAGVEAQIDTMSEQAETNRLLGEVLRTQALGHEMVVAEAVERQNEMLATLTSIRATMAEGIQLAGSALTTAQLAQAYGLTSDASGTVLAGSGSQGASVGTSALPLPPQ